MSENAVLKVEHLKKSFGDNHVLKDISFGLCEGEVLSIIGPSGSGKSRFSAVLPSWKP